MSVGPRERWVGLILLVGFMASLVSAYSYFAAVRDGQAAHAAASVFLTGFAVGVTLLGIQIAGERA